MQASCPVHSGILLWRNALRVRWFASDRPLLVFQHPGGGGPVRQLVALGSQPNRFGVSVFRQGLLGVLASESAMADPAESGTEGNPEVVVDEHDSGPHLPAHPQSPITVLAEHRRNQPERRA